MLKFLLRPTASSSGARRAVDHDTALLSRRRPDQAAARVSGDREAGGIVAAAAGQARLLATFFEAIAAARPEGAALGQGKQRGRHARDRFQPMRPRTVERRDQIEQAPGVGMSRALEDVALGAALDDAAGIHHLHAIGDLGHHAHVVGDQHDGGAEIAPQLLDELEDLRLHGDVERRRGLVGDEERGLQESAMAMTARWRMPPESWWG